MIAAPTQPEPLSVSAENEHHFGTQLELKLADYEVRGASMGHGIEGSSFACTIGPVSDETMAALDRAAESRATICLLFPQPLLLELVTLERREPQRVRIVGRIFDSTKRPSRQSRRPD
jgi:hypothetical protein